ncbi:Kef-type K+ transport system, membrane component KefB [Ruminococcaceae bacterium YRB3002]|nr:Kef-type K+ transport system, membrane component KefB [Ruminococcaceae bacterium YRB3002]
MRLTTLAENEIIMTLIALALLLASAYLFGTLLEKIRGPRVVGEILGGMIIGGSCLFILAPQLSESIFFAYPEEGKVLNIFYQLGLIFLMFLSGYNTDIKVDKSNAKTISLVFTGATVLPMLGSIPFFSFFREYFIGSINNEFSYRLVFAIGVAITSIPVISKIFFDMGIMNTKFSNTVLTVSTFQDLCLWVLLNVATKVASAGEIQWWEMAVICIVTIGIFIAIALISRFIKQIKTEWKPNTFYTLSFILLLLVCGLLYWAGINIMYSAFVVGYLIKAVFGTEETTKTRMHYLENIAFSFFIPVYFALVGIQLNVIHDFSVTRFLMFFGIAFGLEFIGTWLLLLPSKLTMNTRLNFAITMNARGGPGIVLATVAYSYNIISLEFFTVLILTTMLSSMIAGYWLRLQQKRDANQFSEMR